MKTKDILNILQKGSVFGLDVYEFSECSFTQMCCAKCWVYICLNQKWQSCLVRIQKWHKLHF